MTRGDVARMAWPSALIAALVMSLATLVGGALHPGYDHAAQFISELGARGAPAEGLMRYGGFLPAGLALSVFAIAARAGLPRSALTAFGLVGVFVFAIGYLAATAFPCDAGCRPEEPTPTQLLHNALGLAGYVIAPLFLAALGAGLRRWHRGLSAFAFVAAACSLVGLLGLSPSSPYAGLSQRLLEASVLGWSLNCGWMLRRPAPASE
jgi:hypothetical protein